MNIPSSSRAKVVPLAALLFCATPALLAQTGATPGQSNPSSPGSNGSIVQGKDTSPLNSMTTMNMAATRETNALQVFQAVPDSILLCKA